MFKYKAAGADGRTIEGLVEAGAESVAADTLRERGLRIITLEEQSRGAGAMAFVIGRVRPKDIVVFSRQFSVLVSANVALVQSLKLLIEQTENPKLKLVVAELAEEIDGGARLSDSLARRPAIFSNFYVNVIRSGETSGKLDEVLLYLADELEKDYDMTSKIKGAMIYPAFVLSSLGAVGTVMMVFVVPKLTDVLTQGGVELPLATRLLIGTSDALANYWYLFLMAIGGLAAGARFFMQLSFGKAAIDNLLLRLPLFGPLFTKIYLVRFTRSLQTLIKGGVGLSKALDITAEVVSNAVYRKVILDTKRGVEDGESMSSVLMQSAVVPHMVSQMINIGERTGRLDSILESIGKFYTREINNTVANLMTLMEPIIMVVIGIAVGLMVAAIIMPMYNMTGAV